MFFVATNESFHSQKKPFFRKSNASQISDQCGCGVVGRMSGNNIGGIKVTST